MADLISSQTELPIFIGESYEDHVSAWRATVQEMDERQWMLGAIASSLEKKYGEGRICEFADDVNAKPSTIWDYRHVYLIFKNSDMSEFLSWTHHRIASYTDDPLAFLNQCKENGWSITTARHQAKHQKRIAAMSDISPPTCTIADLERLIILGRKFGTIYLDPPWSYGNQGTRAATDNHYETMDLAEIAALPIADLAADESHIHMWTTNAFLHESFHLFEQWGFEFKSFLVWDKDKFGIGNYWRLQTEYLLLGTKGGLTFLDHAQPNIVREARTRHSAKPETIRRMIEKVSPPLRLELFARRISDGWVCWGNEIDRTMFDNDVKEIA